MKISLIIPLLLVLHNFEVHAQNFQFVQTNLDKLELQLSKGFPINTQFNHQDIGNTGNDSLYFRFYYPEFEILGDTVYLSYVEEFKNYSTLPVYSKIEQTFLKSCIDTLETFAFTYGNDDRFEPSLNYIGIHLTEDCKYANRFVYEIDAIDWNTKQPFQNLKLIYRGEVDFIKFPTSSELTLFEKQTIAKENLMSVIKFLSAIKSLLENQIINNEVRVSKLDDPIRQGLEMQKTLEDNLVILHPKNTQFNKELGQQLKLILQSLALYRSDLRNANFKVSDSGDEELKYLSSQIPRLIEKLQCMTTYHKYTDWDKQNKIDELNGYLQAAYGNDAPIHFSREGVYSENVKSIYWSDVKNMSVNRSENKVSISCIDGRDLLFNFTENQYTHIASLHVHFLAFYQKIAESVAEKSVNLDATIQADFERATQILNELLPNENYYITETGVREKDFGMVIEFSINKQLDIPVILINADSSEFEMCCFLGMEEDENGKMVDHYTSTLFSFSPNQLEKVKELKAIFDKVFKSENK